MQSEIIGRIKEIYGKLEDDESKDIFMAHLMFEVTGKWKYIKEMVKTYLRGYSSDYIFTGIEDNIRQLRLEKDSKYVIYGAGTFGRQAYNFLKSMKIDVVAFCDRDMRKSGNFYCSLSVWPIEEIVIQKDTKVLLAVWNQSDNILEELVKKGVEKHRIIDCFIEKNYTDKNQYFDSDIIKFHENEVLVDCGCYDFETSQIFMQKCPDYKKIFCFEPSADNLNDIKQKVSGEIKSKVKIYPYGVWSQKDKLFFDGSGSSVKVSKTGNSSVEVVSIDEEINEKVTFIKMDIEGSEMEALKGAQDTILKYKPRLAISVYHKPDDIIEIPNFILQLVPEYHIFLRHYSNYFSTETVLYAIL